MDTNGDGQISYSEAEAVNFLKIERFGLSDLTGIEAFINLDTLYVVGTEITTLDLSHNTSLSSLKCIGCDLSSLDVSNCFALNCLSCRDNLLTRLDVSDNTALGSSYPCNCYSGYGLPQLNIGNNPNLHEVCVWTMPFPPSELLMVASYSSPNVYFTKECSQ